MERVILNIRSPFSRLVQFLTFPKPFFSSHSSKRALKSLSPRYFISSGVGKKKKFSIPYGPTLGQDRRVGPQLLSPEFILSPSTTNGNTMFLHSGIAPILFKIMNTQLHFRVQEQMISFNNCFITGFL